MGGRVSRIWDERRVGHVMQMGASWRGNGTLGTLRIWGGGLFPPRYWAVGWFGLIRGVYSAPSGKTAATL
jgi:hypothetical protein